MHLAPTSHLKRRATSFNLHLMKTLTSDGGSCARAVVLTSTESCLWMMHCWMKATNSSYWLLVLLATHIVPVYINLNFLCHLHFLSLFFVTVFDRKMNPSSLIFTSERFSLCGRLLPFKIML